MRKPIILVTNDDGVNALGLEVLVSVMREFGHVVVVAPITQQSGKSHSITVGEPLRVKKIKEERDLETYALNGTPVDCMKFGEKVIIKHKPDLVVSGINHGSNATINVLYSGTMGAVVEACISGIPAVGFSLDDYSSKADFSHGKEYIRKIVSYVLSYSLPIGTCLNVNIPSVSAKEIRGMRVCRQAKGYWKEEFEERVDPMNKKYYWMSGEYVETDSHNDHDYNALKEKYVSIVPVKFDLTNYNAIKELEILNCDVEVVEER